MRKKLWKSGVMPMKLQIFAEGDEGGTGENNPAGAEGTQPGEGGGSQGADDVAAQIAALQAEVATLKRAKDNATKEAAEWRRQYQGRLSKSEQDELAAKEAREKADAELAELRNRLTKIDKTKQYMTMYKMDEKEAGELVDLELNGNTAEFNTKVQAHIEALEKASFQKALNGRPGTAAGFGGTETLTTAEQIAKGLGKPSMSKVVDNDILKNYM